ncbi:MAG TPA: NFACT RNA binding domain-containing protein [Chthonomonadaceae bacterium]|nr:NFACT RNA binding domain-containing protein [Chthonomonadaceae bacterium]
MISDPTTTSAKAIKIPFDSLTLRAVVSALRRQLVGGQIQDVRQPAPTELRLGIRSQSRNFLLALSDDARFARVHLTATRLPNAPTPPTFCMTLRKHIEGGVIKTIRQRAFDRIFEMEVETRQDDARVTVTLIAELMGKHSNLVLVNAAGTILDSAKRITHRVNRLRETLPGLPYLPPPEQTEKADPFAPNAVALTPLSSETAPEIVPDALAALLTETYAGMSPFLASELAARAMANADWQAGLRQAWEEIFGATEREEFAPVAVRDAAGHPLGAYPFPLKQWPAEWQTPAADLNAALDEAYTALIKRADFEAVAGELRGKIGRERKRLERQQQSVERALAEADRAEQLKQAGELLLANLWRVQPGDTAVTVQDYYDPALADRVIALDPKLSAQENADAYFRRYRKARDGQETALEHGVKIEAALQQLQDAETRLAGLQTAEAVRSLRAEMMAGGLLRERAEETEESGTGRGGPDFQGHKIRRVTTPEGYEIYYGETATANDFLTTRLAAPNDFWLHVRAATSAHVILRTHGKPADVPRSVLEQAARIAARHSSQKHSSLVAVDYTLKKYVRKPRGAAPGSADYAQETTLEVTP